MKKNGFEGSQALSDFTATETMSEPIQNRFIWAGPVGAVGAATLKSLCCVGPFVLASLGVSGTWIGNLKAFAPYQPLFMFFTVGFLAVGFYKVYANKQQACVSGALCSGQGSGQESKKTNRVVLWIATFLVIFLMSLPYLIGWLT